jgi:hypothetical protein
MSEATKKRWKDPTWKYVPREATDIRKTFARVKRQQKEAEAVKAAKVTPIKTKGTK